MSYGTAYAVEEDRVAADPTEKYQKVKKPGFIKRWIAKIAEDAWNQKREENIYTKSNLVGASTRGLQINNGVSIDQPERAIQFTVYNANGGRIVETRRYDRQKDRNNNGLYVITNDMDFGREIDKIITMEHLK
jgi:hypothetical protein